MSESEIRNPNEQTTAEQAELLTAQAYSRIHQSDDGKIMIADLEHKFACNPFAEGKPDLTAFRCGCLRVLQEIGDQIRHGLRPVERQESVHVE